MSNSSLQARLAKLSPEQRQQLLNKLSGKKNTPTSTNQAEAPAVIREFALSNAQQRMWMFEQFNQTDDKQTANAYNIVSALRFVGQLDLDAFGWALQQLVNRNEIFRTRFDKREQPLQIVEPQLVVKPQIAEPSPLIFERDVEQIQALVNQLSDVVFSLTELPLLRVSCVALADDSTLVVLVMHHILADGWSLRIIEQQLSEYYQAYVNGSRQSVAPDACQYRDFIDWEKQWFSSDDAQKQRDYWRQQLKAAPGVLPLPTLQDRHAELPMTAGSHMFSLRAEQLSAMKNLAEQHQASFFMVFIAAFKLTLAYYSGVDDLVVGTPVANRKRARFDDLIGMLSNSMALRSQPKDDLSFVEYLKQIKALSLASFANQNIPFEEVVDLLGVERSSAHSPLFQVLFALQATQQSELKLGDLRVDAVHIARRAAEFDMIFEFFTTDFVDNQVVLSYQKALFSEQMISRFCDDLSHLIDLLLADSEQHLSVLCASLGNARVPAGEGEQTLALQQNALLQKHQPLNDKDVVLIDKGISAQLAALTVSWAESCQAQHRIVDASLTLDDDGTVAVLTPEQLLTGKNTASLRFVMVNGLCPSTDLSQFEMPVVMSWSMPDQRSSVLKICQNGQSTVAFDGEVAIRNTKGALLPYDIIGQLYLEGNRSGIKAQLGLPEQNDASNAQDTPALSLHGFSANDHQQLNPWHNGCWVDCYHIQQTLLQQPGITNAVVFNRADKQGIGRLVAYLVCDRVLSISALVNKLSAQLSDDELPVAFGIVNQLPLSPQGKIQFDKLQQVALLERELLEQFDGKLTNDLTNLAPIPLPARQQTTPVANAVAGETTPALATGPELDVDSLPACLSQLLVNAAQTDHGITHILNSHGDTDYVSYADLLSQAKAVGQGLLNAGLHQGDRVMLQVADNSNIITAFWGCVVSGMVPLPVTRPERYELDDKDCHKVVSSCDNLQVNALICDADNHEVLQQLIGNSQILTLDNLQSQQAMNEVYRADRESTALLLLTSGSTGLPKSVQQCHRALISRSAATAITGKFSKDTISFNWMPLDHVGGIVMYHLLDVFLGARQIHCPTDIILQQPTLWLDWLSQYRVNSTWAPNFAYALVNEQLDEKPTAQEKPNWDLSSVEFILNGGEAIIEKVARSFLVNLACFGLNQKAMYPSWGMSETCSGVAFNCDFDPVDAPSQHDYVTVGNPVPGVAIRTVDGHGNVTSQGQVGQLQISGATVTQGYLNNAAETQAAFSDDGWFYTGDLAVIDQDGMAITGRAKDLIIINGINYQGQQIEQVVESVEGILTANTAACGVRREADNTDKVAIFFAVSPGYDADMSELKKHIQQACLHDLQVSCSYFIPLQSEEFPRTSIGKIQRAKLTNAFHQGEFDSRLVEYDLATDERYLPAWFYQPLWQCVAPAHQRITDMNTVLVGDNKALFAQLKSSWGETELVALVDVAEYLKLSGQWRVIYLADSNKAIGDLLAMAQAQPEQAAMVRLDVVTEQAFAVNGSAINPQNGALHGFLTSLAQEKPNLSCHQIDVLAYDSTLVNELLYPQVGATIALRNEQRFEYRLGSVMTGDDNQLATFEADKFVLITGGLGGVGRRICEALVRQERVNVLLLGRSELNEEKAGQLAHLQKAGGKVAYQALDITDAKALKQLIADYERQWQQPLGSVLHLAGSLRSCSIDDESAALFLQSMHAKVQGAIAISEALHTRKDVAQIHFGSVNGVLGGSRYSAYAAANSQLEAWCQSQRQAGFKATCLHWSMWDDIGMSAGLDIKAQTRAKGYYLLDGLQGIKSLRLAMHANLDVVVIGVDQSNPFISQYLLQPCQNARHISVSAADKATIPTTDRFGQTLNIRVSGEDETASSGLFVLGQDEPVEIADILASVLCQVLSLSQISYDANFFAVGGDSILAIQVVARARMVGIGLQPRQLFECQTLSELASVAVKEQSAEQVEAFVSGAVATSAIGQWFAQLNLSDPHHMNQSTLLKFKQKPDLDLLQQALQQVVNHHDMLRASFSLDDERLSGVINENLEVVIERCQLDDDGQQEYPERLKTLASSLQGQLSLATKDGAKGQLLKAVYIEDKRSGIDRLLLVVHHLIVDGVSWRILVEDLMFYYQAPRQQALRTHSYHAWVKQWQQYIEQDSHSDDIGFYLAQQQHIAEQGLLPGVNQQGVNSRSAERSIEFKLSAQQSQSLTQLLPAKCNLSINEVLLTGLLQAYSEWTGQQALYLMMEGHGRDQQPANTPDISRTIGWFTSLYPVLLDSVDKGSELETLIATFKAVKTRLASVPNDGLSFNWLRFNGDALNEVTVPQMSFNYLGKFDVTDESQIAFAPESCGDQSSPRQQRLYEIDFVGAMVDGQINFSVVYGGERFDAQTIDTLVQLWQQKLAHIAQQLTHLPRFATVMPTQLKYFDEKAKASAQRLLTQLPDEGVQTLLPATPTQVGLLYESLVSDTKGMYVSQLVNQLRGKLDSEAFKAAWQAIVIRHSIYRSAFHTTDDGSFVQVVMEHVQLPWFEHDWSDLTEAQQEQRFDQLVSEDSQTSFDIKAAPLLRIHLVRLSDDCYRMLLSEHHAVADGWSRGVVLRELAQCYLAQLTGQAVALPAAIGFSEHVQWLSQMDQQPSRRYWQDMLGSIKPCNALAGQQTGMTSTAIEQFDCHFSETLTAKAVAFSKQHRVTLNTIAQLAWALTLSLYTNRDDVVFATTLSGRPAELDGVEEIVGPFINTVPMRITIDWQQTVSELLSLAQRQQLLVTEHCYLPLSDITRISNVDNAAQLFNTLFVLENFPLTAPEQDEHSELWVEWVKSLDKSEFPMAVMLIPGQRMEWVCYYQLGVFTEQVVADVAEHYQQIFNGLLEHFEQPIAQLEMPELQIFADIDDEPLSGDVETLEF